MLNYNANNVNFCLFVCFCPHRIANEVLVPGPGIEPLQWKHKVLATGLPGKPLMLRVFILFCFVFNFYFYFILLYNTVLVLPYIDMNPPRVSNAKSFKGPGVQQREGFVVSASGTICCLCPFVVSASG